MTRVESREARASRPPKPDPRNPIPETRYPVTKPKKMSLQKEIKSKWLQIVEFIEKNFDKKPDLNAVLFLIGIRELGELHEKPFTKEEKTHLMHIANCRVLSYSGYYKLIGSDKKGWPVWEKDLPIPNLTLLEQENLLRQHIIEYFEQEEIIVFDE